MKHTLYVADNLGDMGFGGHWAIGIRDEEGTPSGYYLGELNHDPGLKAAADAVRHLAMDGSRGGALAFQTKKRTQQALRVAKKALREHKEL